MKEIYVTGASGQLGGEIKRIFPNAIFPSRNELDLYKPYSIKEYFRNKSPEVIINCAAYTQVDLAEKEQKLAYICNAESPAILASICKNFIHFSTDYVFDGHSFKPYTEDNNTGPSSIYGKSKLEGEKAIIEINSEAVIIRTSWVYSDLGKNFVKTMLRLGSERSELKVVWDQIGCPTYAFDLASLVVENGLKKWNFKGGVYHFANEGIASWYDFSKAIFDIKGIVCKVIPIKSEEYPTPAKRPHYSVLDKSKIKNELGIEIPHWKESLKICLEKLS